MAMFLRACCRNSNNSFKLLIKDAAELERLKKVVVADSRVLSAAFVSQAGLRAAEGSRVETKFPSVSADNGSGDNAGSTTEKKDEEKTGEEAKVEEKVDASKEASKSTSGSTSGSIFPLELTFSTPIGVQTEKLNALKNTVAQKQKDLLYSMAEFQNLQRKQGTEIAARTKEATKSFSVNLLPIIDALEKEATLASELLEPEHAFVEGIVLTRETAIKSLNRFEVRQLVPQQGDVFVAAKHEEVEKEAPPSADDDATVKCVKENGWMLREEVLRKASVGMYRSEAPRAAA